MNSTDAHCDTLTWDSNFFGLSIARARPSRLDVDSCCAMLEWCGAQHIDCLYFLADSDDVATHTVLEDAQFQRVDERVVFERDVVSDAAGILSDTRPAYPADIPVLRAIAGTSHRDSRFYADPHFDRRRCDELYRVWIENSCRGQADHVIVAESNGSPAGYLTLHLTGAGTGLIGLLGVDAAHRRQGVGQRLLHGGLAWLASQSVSRVSVVTQARNTASLGLYRHSGFRLVTVALWYHRWFDQRDRVGR